MTTPDPTSNECTLEDLAVALDQGAALIDVRRGDEYAAGHVPGALLVPLDELRRHLGKLARPGPVYVICATGNRSSTATDLLTREGFEAYSVAGGTSAWARSSRPLNTDNDS